MADERAVDGGGGGDPTDEDWSKAARLYDRAEVLLQQGRHDAAERMLRAALALLPGHPLLYRSLSHALCEQNRFDEAADAARAAIAIDPEVSTFHFALTRALHRGGRYDESLEPALAAIRLDPDEAHNYVTAAASYYELDRPEECLRYAMNGLSIDPTHAGCEHFRTLALAQLGRADEARDGVKRILAMHPHCFNSCAAGWACWFLGDDEEAARHLREAIRLAPMEAWAHEGLGLVLIRQGDVAGGREHLSEAMRLVPGLVRARKAMAEIDGRTATPS